MKNIIKSFMKRCDFIIKINDSIKEFYYKYLISDERILAKQFKERVGRKLELENPIMFNDKIQWLKLNWKDQLATKCSDKYEVRKIVKERIGDEYLNELIEVYNSVEEIDIRKLPEKFVLKTTHGSGTNIICRNKNEINWEEAFGEMRRWMRTNYYLKKREYAYQDIKPRIICEKFIETDNDKPPNDYKLFCFNGEPKALFIATDRGTNTCFDFYDLEWNHLNVVNHYPNSGKIEKKPESLELMIDLARKLSKGFPHARVDFYYEQNKIIFGEITFYHFSGMEKFEPEEFEKKLGDWLELPQKQDGEDKKK